MTLPSKFFVEHTRQYSVCAADNVCVAASTSKSATCLRQLQYLVMRLHSVRYTNTHTLSTGIELPVQRTAPATDQLKHESERKWFKALDKECNCSAKTNCGTAVKTLLAKIRTVAAQKQMPQLKNLGRSLNVLRRAWRQHSSNHNSDSSAACDYAAMPRELLPRLDRINNYNVDGYPHVSTSTIGDVKAMRYIRADHTGRTKQWHTVQSRLQQYADTGAGTLAEAILYTDCYWKRQIAHEPPSGSKSEAAKRRRNT
jgi:hypothetical protein